MNYFQQIALDLLVGGNLLRVLALLPILALLAWKQIFEQLKSIQEYKFKRINGALECEHVESKTRGLLKEELVRMHCKHAIGVGVRKEFREALIRAHANTEGRLDFYYFKSALPYLHCKNSFLQVKITVGQKWFHCFEFLVGWLFVILGVIAWITSLLILYFPIQELSIGQKFIVFSIGLGFLLVFVLMGLVFFYLTNSFTSARKVEKELKRCCTRTA